MLKVVLVSQQTPRGGVRQYWKAEDFARDEVGYGRRRISAIRDVRPFEERVRRG